MLILHVFISWMPVAEHRARLTGALTLYEVLTLEFQKSVWWGALIGFLLLFCDISPLLGSFIFHNHSFYLIHPHVGTTFCIRYVYVIGQKTNLRLFLESLAKLWRLNCASGWREEIGRMFCQNVLTDLLPLYIQESRFIVCLENLTVCN